MHVAEQTYVTHDEFRAEMAELRMDLRVEIERLRTEIQMAKLETVKWLVGLVGPLYIGMILLLVKAFLPIVNK